MSNTLVGMDLDEPSLLSLQTPSSPTLRAVKQANAAANAAAEEAGRLVPTTGPLPAGTLAADEQMEGSESDAASLDGDSSPDSADASSAARIPPGFPRALFTEGYSYGLRIHPDRLSVQYTQKDMHLLDVGTVRSVDPIPRAALCPIYYFELQVLDGGEKGHIALGIAPLASACLFAPNSTAPSDAPMPRQASLRSHDTASLVCRQVGMDLLSYAYRGDEGKKFHGAAQLQVGRVALAGVGYGPAFGAGDTVGCGVNYYDGSVFFTHNGRNLGLAFHLAPEEWTRAGGEGRGAPAAPVDARVSFYPTVSLHSKGEHVRLNFGASDFAFDIASFRSAEAQRVSRSISATKFDNAALLPLIRSYLLHAGYEKSLEALNQMSSGAGADTSSGAPAPASSSSSASAAAALPQTRHDIVASQTLSARRAIREHIEAGDIESALTAIDALAPTMWSRTSLGTVASPLSVPALHLRLLSLRFVSLLASTSETRVLDALSYAQQHLLVFQRSNDATLRAEAEQVLGLVAYPDVSQSPQAHRLTEEYRAETADRVNAALLANLCAPPHPAAMVHGVSQLELLLRHALAMEAVIKSQGLPLALPPMLEPMEEEK